MASKSKSNKKKQIVYLIPEGETRDSHTWHYTAYKTKTLIQENRKLRLRKYNPVKNRCQFSWYCDGIPDEIYQKQLYREILAFSEAMLAKENILDITDGATHYHADYVLPSWARTKKKTTEIGDHIFYRWAPAARKDF